MSKTKAYFISTNVQGININLKGREPNGIVEPGEEYEQMRNQIIRYRQIIEAYKEYYEPKKQESKSKDKDEFQPKNFKKDE